MIFSVPLENEAVFPGMRGNRGSFLEKLAKAMKFPGNVSVPGEEIGIPENHNSPSRTLWPTVTLLGVLSSCHLLAETVLVETVLFSDGAMTGPARQNVNQATLCREAEDGRAKLRRHTWYITSRITFVHSCLLVRTSPPGREQLLCSSSFGPTVHLLCVPSTKVRGLCSIAAVRTSRKQHDKLS